MTSELRIKIAETLGWRSYQRESPLCPPSVTMWKNPDGRIWGDCPRFLEDANAALQLVEVLKNDGWDVIIERTHRSSDNMAWYCCFYRGKRFYSERAETAPGAICLAYCAVRGIAEKGKEA